MTCGRIVAGVDWSSEHLGPIEWAYREAARRKAALDLVHAWNLPLEISPLAVPAETSDPAIFEAGAKPQLNRAVAAVAPSMRDAVRSVSLATPCAGASRALLEASANVGGSSGSAGALRWAMNEAVLWDVPLTVVHSWYAPYPVEPWGVVVTPDDRELFIEDARAVIDKMARGGRGRGCLAPAQGGTDDDRGGRRRWWALRSTPTCWSWALGAVAGSPRSCSGRPASTACITCSAPSPSSQPRRPDIAASATRMGPSALPKRWRRPDHGRTGIRQGGR